MSQGCRARKIDLTLGQMLTQCCANTTLVARVAIRDHLGAAACFLGQGPQVWEVAQSSSIVNLRTREEVA